MTVGSEGVGRLGDTVDGPGAGFRWVSQLPQPARTDDRNPWVDGSCWFWCRQAPRRVLFVGPMTVAGLTVSLYACEPCIRQLHIWAWEATRRADGTMPG